MKKLGLLSLVGITSIALAHTGWAAGHGGGCFHGGGFHGGGHFSSMPGGHTFVPGGIGTRGSRNWSGRNWNGNWRHHRFSNDVVFIGDVGFPWWWGWYDPYGYYGYDYYPYDSYGYGGYGYGRYGYYDHSGYRHRHGSRSGIMRRSQNR